MKELLLSILIPTTPDRNDEFLIPLMRELRRQIYECSSFEEVEILPLETPKYEKNNPKIEHSIAWKRNALLDMADGKYLQFHDSDDFPLPGYLRRVLEGCRAGVDCCSLKGIYTEEGLNPAIFEHSIKYKEWKTNPPEMPVRYERGINHLNCVRSDIAKQMKFPTKKHSHGDQNHGEDHSYSDQLQASGLLLVEHHIDEPIYQYLWKQKND